MDFHGAYTDIDALCLNVRDPGSKKLILEALRAYRAGALRSAIVATWIAVVYDVLAKARELAAQGEPEPAAIVKDLDHAIATNQVKKINDIESSCLETAHEKLELLQPQEYEALGRLKKDRHLCAHPAFVETDEVFQPMPELVRTHITHALQYLLIHPPLQGKAAIRRFDSDLEGNSLPTQERELRDYFRVRYLTQAKSSLVVQLLKGLLKALVGSESQKMLPKRKIIVGCLKEIASYKTEIFEKQTPSFVNQTYSYIEDDRLLAICPLLEVDDRFWSWLSDIARLRIRALAQTATFEQLQLFGIFSTPWPKEVQGDILERLLKLGPDQQLEVITSAPRSDYIQCAFQLYSTSDTFRRAEQIGNSAIVPLAYLFEPTDTEKLLNIVSDNTQIFMASLTTNVLEKVFDQTESSFSKTKPLWEKFVAKMVKQQGDRDSYYAYPSIQSRLAKLETNEASKSALKIAPPHAG